MINLILETLNEEIRKLNEEAGQTVFGYVTEIEVK